MATPREAPDFQELFLVMLKAAIGRAYNQARSLPRACNTKALRPICVAERRRRAVYDAGLSASRISHKNTQPMKLVIAGRR